MTVCRVDSDALERDRDQLWAEVREAYRAGERWWPTPELADDVTKERDARYRVDPWEGIIAERVAGRRHVTVGDVLEHALQIDKGKWDRGMQMRVANVLSRLGWVRKRVKLNDTRRWVYVPKENVDDSALA